MRQLSRSIAVVVFGLFAAQGVARADFEASAILLGATEVPSNGSPGTGFADIVFHSMADSITYKVTFADLLANASVAHIHIGGPTVRGPVVLPLTNMGPPAATSGTFSGTLTNADIINQGTTGLTDIAQIAAQIEAGNAYVNIHTSVYPGGEIRGQLEAVPEPSSLILLGIGTAGLIGYGWHRRRKAIA